jgi:hypothetical protein
MARWGIVGTITAGLAVTMALVAAAGQAVGPVLSGSVTGTTALTAEQAVLLDTDLPVGENPQTFGADDAVTTRNDKGTQFAIAAELHVGQQMFVCLYLENKSEADAAAILELNVPQGIDVELEEFSDDGTSPNSCDGSMNDDDLVGEAQFERGAWLMRLSGSADVNESVGNFENDGVRLTIEPKDDLKPGFYTISGQITQIGG